MAQISIFVLIATLILALLAGVISWVLYRAHLNRAVRGEASSAHSKFLSPAELFPWIAVILLLIWNGSTLSQFAHVTREVDSLQNRVLTLQNELRSLPDDIAGKILEANSLLSFCDWTITGLDKENRTAGIRVSLTPKTVADDTAVSLSVGLQTVRMEREEGLFTADLNVSLFEDYGSAAQAVITSGGISRFQQIPGLSVAALWRDFLPQGDVLNSTVSESLKDGMLTLKGSIDCCLYRVKDGVSPTEMALLFERNGTEVKRIALGLSEEPQTVDVSGSYEASSSDNFSIFLVVKNDLGLSVKMLIRYYIGDGPAAEESAVSVINADGTVLFAD